MTSTDKTGKALRAQAILDLGEGEPKVMDFDAVSIGTEDPENLVVALADAQGRTLTLLLPRREVKALFNWRMLMSL